MTSSVSILLLNIALMLRIAILENYTGCKTNFFLLAWYYISPARIA